MKKLYIIQSIPKHIKEVTNFIILNKENEKVYTMA